MNFNSINGLIEKYFAGETSLEEEKILRGYFNGADVDARLASYMPLFQFFEKEKTIVFEDAKMPPEYLGQNATKVVGITEVKTQNSKLSILRGGQFWKVAAAVVFLAIAGVAVKKAVEKQQIIVEAPKKHKAKMIILDGEGDSEVALQKVNEALALVSKKMRKGTEETTDGLMKLRDATSILNKEN
jgi:hypothetical protein